MFARLGLRPTTGFRDRAVDLLGLMTTPLLPADYLDLVSPLRAGGELRGRIVEIQSESADAATLVIRPGRDWAVMFPVNI